MGSDDIKQRKPTDEELKARLAGLRRKMEARRKQTPEEADGRGIPSRLSDGSPRPARTPKAVVYRRNLPQPAPPAPARKPLGPPVVLEEALEGAEIQHGLGGKAFLVRRCISEVRGATTLSERFGDCMARDGSGLRRHVREDCELDPAGPDDMVFLDIETAGLGSSPLFLVGLMVWTENGLEAEQYLARNYAEERAVIGLCGEALAARRVLVTFNGKSFDVPFVRARARAAAVPFEFSAAHFDLLHVCRRIWKDVLPDCRLQTLEAHICRRARFGDIPGERIPDAYHAFVRTGDARELVQIMEHNMLDLVTLADIMSRLPEPNANPRPDTPPAT